MGSRIARILLKQSRPAGFFACRIPLAPASLKNDNAGRSIAGAQADWFFY